MHLNITWELDNMYVFATLVPLLATRVPARFCLTIALNKRDFYRHFHITNGPSCRALFLSPYIFARDVSEVKSDDKKDFKSS